MSATNGSTPTSIMRERLLAGQPVTTEGSVEEFGVSKALLSVLARQLRKEGHRIDADGKGTYALVTNGEAPAKKAKRATKARKGTAKRATVRTQSRRRQAGTGSPATAPSLDAALIVCGLVRGEDGALRVHCREGARTWAMTVEAVME